MGFTLLVLTNEQNIRKKESKLLDSPVQILSQFLHLVTEANDTLLLFFFQCFYSDFEKIKIIFTIPVRGLCLMSQTCNLSLSTNRGEQHTLLWFSEHLLAFCNSIVLFG